MDMTKAIVEHFTRVLSRHQFDFVNLNYVGNHLQGLSKKQKAYLKKTGYKKFFINHPNNFAVIDENIVLVANEHPSDEINPNINRNDSKPPTSLQPIIPPSKSTMESIKKDIEQSNFCVICSDDMKVYAFGTCFHPICYKCCTKLRVLCSDKHCPVCRTELSQAIFTFKLEAKEDLDLSTFVIEQKYGLYFESIQIRSMYKTLLEHRCPKSNCITRFNDFDELKRHMQRKHGEYFCNICVKQCKIFTHDRKTYSSLELKEHEEEGDAGDGSAHKGHPLCKFCESRYLDKDELLRHLQQHHCTCHLCESSNYVFYADNTDLWSHFQVDHFACNEPECIGKKSNAFAEESELQLHKSTYHIAKKGKSTKRVEQPILMDVTYSNRERGLLFSSPSRSVDVSSVHSSPASIQADGSIRCNGRVIRVTSFFGFIEREGGTNFEDNIFFSQESYGLDINDDLKLHVNVGDRVRVHAIYNNNHRSNWRAIDVIKEIGLTDTLRTYDEYLTDRTRTNSVSSDLTSNGVTETDVPDMAKEAFPSLPGGVTPEIDRAPNPSGFSGKNWNKVLGTKPAVVKPSVASAAVATSSTSKNVTKSEDILRGIGIIHHNLQPQFGFITKPGTAFEDNIYFNIQAYKLGNNSNTTDLTKELKSGQEIAYELEELGAVKRQTKSKYRAVKVWKPAANEPLVNKKSPLTSSAITKTISSASTKQPQPTTSNVSVSDSFVTPKGKKKKKKNKPTELSTNFNTINPTTNGHTSTLQLNNMDLDTFGTPPSQYFTTYLDSITSTPSNDEIVIFREVLEKFLNDEINSDEEEETLFQFDNELEIQGFLISQVAHIHFAADDHPVIHSVLLSDGTKNDFIIHKSFNFDSVIGFNEEAIDFLCASGVARRSSDDFYYINRTGMYITIRRDAEGDIDELDLHTSFKAS